MLARHRDRRIVPLELWDLVVDGVPLYRRDRANVVGFAAALGRGVQAVIDGEAVCESGTRLPALCREVREVVSERPRRFLMNVAATQKSNPHAAQTTEELVDKVAHEVGISKEGDTLRSSACLPSFRAERQALKDGAAVEGLKALGTKIAEQG